MKSNGFPKSKKLKKENEISLLFKKGKWKTVGNIRVITYSHPDFAESKIGVSASKRYFKKAVDRNRVKRLLREAYRLHQNEFEAAFGNHSLIMFFWVSPKLPADFQEVEKNFLQVLAQKKQ